MKYKVQSGKWEVGSGKWEVRSGKWKVQSTKYKVGKWKLEIVSIHKWFSFKVFSFIFFDLKETFVDTYSQNFY